MFHATDKENELEAPSQYKRCIHGKTQNTCERRTLKRKATNGGTDANAKAVPSKDGQAAAGKTIASSQLCYHEDDLKYRMTRVSLENINVFVVEAGCACNLEVSRVEVSS